MDFSNYLLYEDEDMRIEIDGKTHFYIDTVLIPHIKPPKFFLATFFPFVINWLKKKDPINEKKNVKFCGQAPVIQYGKFAMFSEPFNVFELAQSILAEVESLNGNEEEIEKMIEDGYKECLNEKENFYCKIFKEKIEDIKGYFIYINEEEILIMVWGFEMN